MSDSKSNNRTVVVLTSGKQDRGVRATLAFGWACAAQAMGKDVSIFLTMDGTIWGINGAPDGIQVDGFDPLAEYLEEFLELDGELLVCAPCTEYYCSYDPELMAQRLHPRAQICGLATVVGRVDSGGAVVTF